MLFDKLQQLGNPHIPNFDHANKEQVFKCIRDKTGRFLSQDEFVLYEETEEEIEKPKYKFTGDAKEALKTITMWFICYVKHRQILLEALKYWSRK